MDNNNLKLSHAVLHEPLFLPGKNGKGLNLKNILDINSQEGKQVKLEMTLIANAVVEVKTNNSTGLVPLSNFKLVVMAE